MRNSNTFDSCTEIEPNFKYEDNYRNIERATFVSASLIELGKLLSVAASEGKHREVSKLITNGASVTSFGLVGMNALHLASMNGHYKVCKILLDSGVVIDSKNKVGKTALHLAAVNGHVQVVHHLLKAGAIVDSCDMVGMTPLHWACDRGHESVVSLLLQYNANPNHRNKFQKSPFNVAYEKRNFDIVTLIKDRNREESSTYENITDFLDTSFEDLDCSSRLSNSDETNVNYDSADEIQIISEEFTPSISKEEIVRSDVEDIRKKVQNNFLNEEMSSTSSVGCEKDDEDLMQEKLLNSLNKLEAFAFVKPNSDAEISGEADELLRAQAALVSLEDPSRMLRRAIFYGQTIQLTEAGERALAMIRPEPFIIPSEEEKKEEDDDATESQTSSQANNAVVLHNINKSIHDLLNELSSCASPPKQNGPPVKRYKR